MPFWILVIVASFLLSHVEIQIEGKHGYAGKLPVTWRASNKWVKNTLGGTSYHLYMWGFMLSILHIPFVVGLEWTIGREFLVVSFLLFVTVIEDFLWFVFNPAYGIRKYKRDSIPWFKDRWLGFCPGWYWWYVPVAVLLYLIGK